MSLFRRQADREAVVDLTESEPVVDVTESSGLVWGMPLPCPKCEKPGYLDRIDPTYEVMYQHCPTCYCRWETDRADLETFVSSS